MPYTYNDDPVAAGTASQKRDAVRALAQDNQASRMRVSDAEIAFLLTQESNIYTAAARCAEMVAGHIGNVTSRRVGDTSISYGPGYYTDLARTLRQRGQTYASPYAGALTNTDKTTTTSDTDRTDADMTRGMFENPTISATEQT